MNHKLIEAMPACSELVRSRLARAAQALDKLADAYTRQGAEALARETRCIADALNTRSKILSGGGGAEQVGDEKGESQSGASSHTVPDEPLEKKR